ncbi:tripartite tricarboxylate transporter substrate binding protein [Roseomonas terrae]|jgi:tripartite-type tricarboxylate transporter receptor subunit TctC|uniref:Tripartite tricarboxylate transporter substrate binding protein n=1 Tax=Neoroseomonas terrae TaxID=424799 RepID=A0ABS5EBF0_9PROT|nr:tripartite tricarboxylate transporter substrate binding protein [Neoroseomonas terrae]MBR0648352.1 tripartite tricarboxylate transporter substrate binding protein [Neoroseomonas terrae]
MTRALLILALALAWPWGQASAQYPDRPITMIVPLAAGGGTDGVARILAEQIGQRVGQAVVIDNRGGANGVIGAQAAARARPDGYTLFMTTGSTQTITPVLMRNLPYDPVRDFTPIARIGVFPLILATNPELPARSVQELVALARTRPGGLTYGQWSPLYIAAGRTFAMQTGVDILEVPYRGSPPTMSDVIAGRLSMVFVDMTVGLPLVRAGSLRPLAVTTARRSPMVPDLPTMQESGIADYDISAWMALYGPTGIPQEVVDRMGAATLDALASPAVVGRLAELGFDVMPGDAATLATHAAQELARWRALVAAANITIE